MSSERLGYGFIMQNSFTRWRRLASAILFRMMWKKFGRVSLTLRIFAGT